MNNIYLCGFMGCGKTTIGKIIANNLKLKCIDTDQEIITSTNMQISRIFELKQESYFRNLEIKCIKHISNMYSNIIVSLGGGTIINNPCVKYLTNTGYIVFLNVPFQVCYTNLLNSSNDRPIFINNNYNKLKKIYYKRKQTYKYFSHITINYNESYENMTNNLYAMLYEWDIK